MHKLHFFFDLFIIIKFMNKLFMLNSIGYKLSERIYKNKNKNKKMNIKKINL